MLWLKTGAFALEAAREICHRYGESIPFLQLEIEHHDVVVRIDGRAVALHLKDVDRKVFAFKRLTGEFLQNVITFGR